MARVSNLDHLKPPILVHYSDYILDYYPNGNIKQVWKDSVESVQPSTKLKWARQVLEIISSLHKLDILHGDIKPENCLLDTNLNIVLCDFNSAEFIKPPQTDSTCRSGSMPFLPPECLQTPPHRSFPSDIWSYGCLLFELFTGITPFYAETEYLSMRRIMDNDFAWLPPFVLPTQKSPDSDSALHFIHTDKQDAIEHPYDQIKDLIEKCLERDQSKRITAQSALLHPLFRVSQ